MRKAPLARPFVVLGPLVLAAMIGACSWDPGKLFDRPDPEVERARQTLEASAADGDADLAAARLALEQVLKFRCESDGGRDLVIDRPFASLDLGLVIFRVAELIGGRFGDEEADVGEGSELVASQRARELDCAQLLLNRLASDPTTPPDIALRARYLLGNFSFLARKYKDAIAQYDQVLTRHPARGIDPQGEIGPPADDDAVARDAAWNRAIALKRLQDEDAGPDAGADASDDASAEADGASEAADAASESSVDTSVSDTPPDGGDSGEGGPEGGSDSGDAGPDGSGDAAVDGGRDGGGDAGADASNNDKGDGGADGGEAGAPPPSPSSAPPPKPSTPVDLRELDRFDKKAPIDLDLPQKLKERKKIPKNMDK